MKIERAIIICLFCIPYYVNSQDLIVTTEQDSLDCNIKLIDIDGNISFKMKNDRYGGYLSEEYVLYYERSYFRKIRADRNVHKANLFIDSEGFVGKYSLDALTDIKINNSSFTRKLEMAFGGGLAINFFIKRGKKNPVVNFLFGFQADYYQFSAGPKEIIFLFSTYERDYLNREVAEARPISEPEPVDLKGTSLEIGPTFTVATNNRYSTSLTYSLKLNTYNMTGKFGGRYYLSKVTSLNNEVSLSQTILPIKNIAALNLTTKYVTGSYQKLTQAIGVRYNEFARNAELDGKQYFNNLFFGCSIRVFIR